MNRIAFSLLIAAVLLPAAPVRAEVMGYATVIDGNTMQVGNTRVRLYGIDAPAAKQTCEGPGKVSYPCGEAAAKVLSGVTNDEQVRCEAKQKGKADSVTAVCWAGPIELNRMMVAQGWALAADAKDYAAEEAHARKAHLGIWSGSFEPPADWRRRHAHR